MAQRADLLEFDCQLTRDGVVVVSHDKNLSRQSGLNKDVNTLDFEELPLYKEELEIYFSPGHFAHGSDRHMISLEDVFQKFPRTPMCLEVKERNEELIHKVANLTRRFDRNEITIWAAEKSSVMKRCRAAVERAGYIPLLEGDAGLLLPLRAPSEPTEKLLPEFRNPEMPMAFTIWRSFWILLLYYLGLLPFVSIPEKFFFCFLPTIINRTYFPFRCGWMNQLSATITKWIIMRKSLIRHLQDRGVQVLFWCLNEESDFEVAFSLGANGVMTDYPTALRHYLDKQEEETQPPQPEALSCLSLKK